MNCKCSFALVGIAAVGIAAGSIAFAQDYKERAAREAQNEMQLPPGWTEEDMQACVMAGMPGEMQAHLTKDAGVWTGEAKMWKAPDTEPMISTTNATITPMYDGRYVKCEYEGQMPGMGTFNGLGLYGYDNIAQEFQSTWIDNHSSGVMYGTGKLSSDGTTLTWTYSYHCPINKKPTTLREIDRITGANTKTMEMWGKDPKTGEEFKMMQIDFTRSSKATAAGQAR